MTDKLFMGQIRKEELLHATNQLSFSKKKKKKKQNKFLSLELFMLLQDDLFIKLSLSLSLTHRLEQYTALA
jgi:hypothetical protein